MVAGLERISVWLAGVVSKVAFVRIAGCGQSGLEDLGHVRQGMQDWACGHFSFVRCDLCLSSYQDSGFCGTACAIIVVSRILCNIYDRSRTAVSCRFFAAGFNV